MDIAGLVTARPIAGIFILLLLTGCAAPQTRLVMSAVAHNTTPHIELTGVPFFAQEAHQCGPAALATVINEAGIEISPQALVSQVYLPAREGSLQADMLAASRRYGLVAYPLAPSLEDVLAEVAGGTPVLILQNLAFDWYPVWHYAVVVGYDLDRGEMILRSGLERCARISLSTFERTWARADYWAIVVVPPQRLPRTAQETPYVAAVAAVERIGQLLSARAGYKTTLRRWPDNLTARIGMGNTYYQQGDLQRASLAFREASTRHPDSADAFNNLAQVLGELGEVNAAKTAAKTALRLGGPHSSIYRETLQQLEATGDK